MDDEYYSDPRYDYFDEDTPNTYTTRCSRCGEGELTWGNDGRKWYLINKSDSRAHVCEPATVDDFEVIQ